MKKIIIAIMVMLLITGCSEKTSNEEITNPVATLTMQSGEVITIELDFENAPNTVKNFVKLSEEGFYDGLTFHRVIKDFVVQGGDPLGNGMGGPGYSIKGEFTSNGFDNPLTNDRGTIAMARSVAADSAGSQFYFNLVDNAHLDGSYAVFGKVTSGMDVIDEIANIEVDANGFPATDIVIKSVTIETNGVKYDDLEIID